MEQTPTKRIRILSPSSESDSDDSQATQLYLPPFDSSILSIEVKVSDEELLSSHFGNKMQKKDIPLWSKDRSFKNMIGICPKPITERCNVCERLCFSVELRGHSFVDKEWFFDSQSDYADPSNIKQYFRVHQEMEKYLRDDEIELRNISRKSIYEQLILRFRNGQYSKRMDYIDLLEDHYHFYDYRSWILWKIKWDDSFLDAKLPFDDKYLFCCVCGKKCKQISEGKRSFQVCNKKGCNFLYNMKSEKVYVGPKTMSF